MLPDGTEFTTWEAPTKFKRTYHVNASHPRASDANSGTAARPFATINHAAQVLQPGGRVVVGPGIQLGLWRSNPPALYPRRSFRNSAGVWPVRALKTAPRYS